MSIGFELPISKEAVRRDLATGDSAGEPFYLAVKLKSILTINKGFQA
jgi:hypothetical protein